MFLRLLSVLPFILNSAFSQGIPKQSADCEYVLYSQTVLEVRNGRLLDGVPSFDACLTECAKYNTNIDPKTLPCEGITYFANSQSCYRQTLDENKSISEMLSPHTSADSAVVKKCRGYSQTLRVVPSDDVKYGENLDVQPSISVPKKFDRILEIYYLRVCNSYYVKSADLGVANGRGFTVCETTKASIVADTSCSPPPPHPTEPVPTTTTAKPTTKPPPYSAPVGCGLQDSQYMPMLSINQRILRGREAVPHSWPWQLSLRDSGDFSFCGASLLRVRADREESDMILTAGHCIPMLQTGELYYEYITVKAGKHATDSLEAGEQARKIVDLKRHESYVNFLRNDILIARLDSPIRFSKTIRPICLPTQDEKLPLGKVCYGAGWGRTDGERNDVYADRLRQVSLPINTDDVCNRGWSTTYNSTTCLCAGDGVATTCNADSGGTLVCRGDDNRWTQYGIVSFGIGNGKCTSTELPAVYTRVSSYINWIQDKIRRMSTLL